jgi:putative oxidoreductase
VEILFLIGRIICGGYFVSAGAHHFKELGPMSDYARSKGTPAPTAAVGGTGAMLVLGGLSLMAGVAPTVGIALLVVFLLAAAFQMHRFWSAQDQQMRAIELVNFTKNLGLAGALLMLLAIPKPWPWSL